MAQTGMNEIDARAADWAARFDGAEPGPEVERALDIWLSQDVRHVGAFARAQAMLIAYGDSISHDAPDLVSNRRKVAAPDRRRLLWGSGMAAGLAALGVGGVWLASAETAYATGIGERRTIALKGGNQLTLNTLTQVRVRDEDVCRVRFLDGEILVQSTGRAVRVSCDAAVLSAANAEFSVRRQTAETVMTVLSGDVTVDGLPAPVNAGGRVRLAPDAPVLLPALDAAALERGLTWRNGRLAFEGETLRDAVAEFGRYSATPIVLADRATGDRRITGLFAADDPAGFARAVAVTSGLRADSRDGRIYLSEPIS
ncbi:FecR family protein [soil metagenome]